MRKLFITLCTFTLIFSCKSNIKKKLDETLNTPLGMTVVVCKDGSSYATSQGWLGGCKNSEVHFLIYDVDIKIGQMLDPGTSNYKDVEMSKIDLKRHEKVLHASIQGKKCSCTYNNKEYIVKCIGLDCNCDDICVLAAEALKDYIPAKK